MEGTAQTYIAICKCAGLFLEERWRRHARCLLINDKVAPLGVIVFLAYTRAVVPLYMYILHGLGAVCL